MLKASNYRLMLKRYVDEFLTRSTTLKDLIAVFDSPSFGVRREWFSVFLPIRSSVGRRDLFASGEGCWKLYVQKDPSVPSLYWRRAIRHLGISSSHVAHWCGHFRVFLQVQGRETPGSFIKSCIVTCESDPSGRLVRRLALPKH